MISGFKRSKKGSIVDILFIIIVLLVIGIGFFFIKFVFDDINTDLLSDSDLSIESKTMISEGNQDYTSWSDNAFSFLFFGLLISVLITSFLIDSDPVFFVVSIIAFIFVIFVGGVVGNVFFDTVNESDMVSLQASYPITMFIMNNLLLLITVCFVLMTIVLYGKSQGLGGGGGVQ